MADVSKMLERMRERYDLARGHGHTEEEALLPALLAALDPDDEALCQAVGNAANGFTIWQDEQCGRAALLALRAAMAQGEQQS